MILTRSRRTIEMRIFRNTFVRLAKFVVNGLGMTGTQECSNVKESSKDKKMDTVLVVEDSRAMQRTLQRLLEADSLNVQIASDGISGLEIFRKQQPSAVLLDLKLPGLSGKELCREFKRSRHPCRSWC